MPDVHDDMDWTVQIARDGYGITASLFEPIVLQTFLDVLKTRTLPPGKAGIRHVMAHPAVSEIARSNNMVALASSALQHSAVPFRATLFDKSPNSNWLVAWHQDTALPLKEKREAYEWGPWSSKEGVAYAHDRLACWTR